MASNNLVTALFLATQCGNLEHLRSLVRGGVRLDVQNDKGETPFHVAARLSDGGVLKALCDLTANKNVLDIQDNKGWTALHHAVHWRLFGNTLCLLKNSAFVDCRNEDGDTPLHEAMHNGYFENVELFVYFGASVHVKNNRGYTVKNLLMDQIRTLRRLPQEVRMNIETILLALGRAYSSCKEQDDIIELLLLEGDNAVDSDSSCELKDYIELLLNTGKYAGEDPWTTSFRAEVRRIKTTIVDDEFSLYDLVSQCDHPSFLLDEDLVEKLENLLFSPEFLDTFPNYGKILRTKYKSCRHSKYFLTLQAGNCVLSGRIDKIYRANTDVWREIFSYISEKDLMNFIKSFRS